MKNVNDALGVITDAVPPKIRHHLYVASAALLVGLAALQTIILPGAIEIVGAAAVPSWLLPVVDMITKLALVLAGGVSVLSTSYTPYKKVVIGDYSASEDILHTAEEEPIVEEKTYPAVPVFVPPAFMTEAKKETDTSVDNRVYEILLK